MLALRTHKDPSSCLHNCQPDCCIDGDVATWSDSAIIASEFTAQPNDERFPRIPDNHFVPRVRLRETYARIGQIAELGDIHINFAIMG
ncbi:hypothetical protein Y032_0153g2910 [Ancylostoma ceylanicum]|uniref:Uncharacterized protein n=1 Tax=Ancylostoma ceylanicum TaxID=53326 RepID=A0A016SZG7_9BILA|nr:hypothetical protein Y032_0153g2910 [Ancylostoma ceylanicum]